MKSILIILGIGITFIFVGGCAVMFGSKQKERIQAENQAMVENYPNEINSYLEQKYGKEFIVNPNFIEESAGGPIPGASYYSPCIFQVRERGGENHMFRVYLYPESVEDNTIKEIRDNYCWRFLGNQVKAYFEEELKEIIPKEHKMIFFTNTGNMFENVINTDTAMEDYFRLSQKQVLIILYIVIPPTEQPVDQELLEQELYPTLNEFYKDNNENMKLRFLVWQTETLDAYNEIDPQKFENERFYVSTEKKTLQNSVDMETIVRVILE